MIELHGRREERARIAALLAGAHASRASVLVIRGEPGRGKSSLLREASERRMTLALPDEARRLLALHGGELVVGYGDPSPVEKAA